MALLFIVTTKSFFLIVLEKLDKDSPAKDSQECHQESWNVQTWLRVSEDVLMLLSFSIQREKMPKEQNIPVEKILNRYQHQNTFPEQLTAKAILICFALFFCVIFTKLSSQRRLKKLLLLHLWPKLLHASRTAVFFFLLFSRDKLKHLEQVCSHDFSKPKKTPTQHTLYRDTHKNTSHKLRKCYFNYFKTLNYTVFKQIDPCPCTVF